MAMYDNDNIVQKSFNDDFITEALLQAQWAEFIELKKVIYELYKSKERPIFILDIGIGNARVPKHLSGIDEVWQMIARYDGTDNAMACVQISNEVIASAGIGNKVKAYLFEAADLDKWEGKYDLVITTWFTGGNFYPDDFSFSNYRDRGVRLDLSRNEKFQRIFSLGYNLLEPGGEVVIGACYIDNNNTRLKQEAAYKKMGMTIITDEMDSFTATREGFWSQRFTKEKLYTYLHFVEPGKIDFTPLDTYNYAMQVRIRK